MKNKEKYSETDWARIAAILSGEKEESSDDIGNLGKDDVLKIEKQWRNLREMSNEKEINVDKAWDNTFSRIKENGLLNEPATVMRRIRMKTYLRIAAMALIVIGLGSGILYLGSSGFFSKKVLITSNTNQRNVKVSLPDGSTVYLNRSSELSYNRNFGRDQRNIRLKGEAFFEITHDASRPFLIDAGQATVKVLGTTFNVITNNDKNEVEVFVKTGRVMVSDNSGSHTLVLDPGDIGKVNSKSESKMINEDPNYISWNTDLLIYKRQPLEKVFSDLKKVYNINIIADDPGILDRMLTATYDKEPQDTIIQLICSTFTLSYKKEGDYYHLSKK